MQTGFDQSGCTQNQFRLEFSDFRRILMLLCILHMIVLALYQVTAKN